MINYECLIKACVNLGLDPTVTGKSITMNGHLLNTYEVPFDLKIIGFPEEEYLQITEIGKMFYNLKSQVVHFYDFSKEKGKIEYERDTRIKSILVTMKDAMDFWLKSGLKKAKEQRKLVISNGKVFEINPSYHEKALKMDEEMAEVRRDFQNKQANSEKSAENIILR